MFVGLDRMKSSPVSISIFPVLDGREAVPMSPSGLPVLKENGVAVTGAAEASVILKKSVTVILRYITTPLSEYGVEIYIGFLNHLWIRPIPTTFDRLKAERT